MKNIKWLVLAISVLAIAALACGGGGSSGDGDSTSIGSGSASLTVINNSSQDVWYLYISPSSEGSWGDDTLGSQVISAGETYTITGIEPGTYDLKADDSDNNELASERNVEIDGNVTWTLTD